jgi:hypothetical protein
VAKLGEGKACPERSRRGSASQEARIRTKMDAPSIRVLCEWAGKHDTPARTGGSRGLQASEKSAATPRPSGPNSTTLTCFCNRARLQSCRTLLLPRSVILNGARLGPCGRVSARGVSEVKDLLLRKLQSARKGVPRPFAFFANGRESTTPQLVPEGPEAFRPRKSQQQRQGPSGPDSPPKFAL